MQVNGAGKLSYMKADARYLLASEHPTVALRPTTMCIAVQWFIRQERLSGLTDADPAASASDHGVQCRLLVHFYDTALPAPQRPWDHDPKIRLSPSQILA
jgi:hypothetical protein